LKKFGAEAYCLVADPDVAKEAKERGKFSFLRGLFKILVRNVDAITYSKVRNYIRLHGNKNEKRQNYNGIRDANSRASRTNPKFTRGRKD